MIQKSLKKRFEEKVLRQPDGCWLWTGAVDRKGYGVIGIGWKKPIQRVHRVSYRLYKGIAKRFGVCSATISNIKTGKTWANGTYARRIEG